MPNMNIIRRVVLNTPVAAAPVVYATWNPADKNANLVLSDGNLNGAQTPGNPGAATVGRATPNAATGKKYFEWRPTDVGTFCTTGLANASASLSAFLGGTNDSVSYLAGGNVFITSSVATLATYTTNDTISIAVDLSARLIWFRVNGGNWNNSGGADPATGSGGIDISAVTGSLFPAAMVYNDTDSFTSNFGATAYAYSVPAGFGNW